MKRFALLLTMLVAIIAASVVTAPSARAGLFGGEICRQPIAFALAVGAADREPRAAFGRDSTPRRTLKKNPSDQQAMTELAGQFLQINRPDLTLQLTQHLLQDGR